MSPLATTQSDNPVFNASTLVMNEAQHVQVNPKRIDAFARNVDPTDFELPAWDAPVFPDPTTTPVAEQFLFMLTGMSLNYCFHDVRGSAEKYRTEWLGTEWEGAFGMWAALKRATETDDQPDIYSPAALSSLTPDAVTELFAPCDGTTLPLIDERTAALNEIGSIIVEQFGGEIQTFYEGFVPNDTVTAATLTNHIIETFDSFADTATYGGRDTPFNKRAQLLPLMLAGYWQDSTVSITETDWLTLPADYGVPATLRGFNLITVTDESLAARIDNGEEIMAGATEEVELRAATVVAGEYLVAALTDYHETDLSTPEVDYYLWSRRNEVDVPTHQTLTTAY